MRGLCRKSLVITIILGMLVGWFSTLPTASGSLEGRDTITVAFTHDLHDHYLPLKVEGQETTLGGFARLATAIEREREKDPKLVLVDAGDYSMGTLFQMLFSQDSPGLKLLGHMGYDAVTLGNHEFDFLPEGLARHLEIAREGGPPLPAIVASNMEFPAGELPADLLRLQQAVDSYPVQAYTILERQGIRIGLFGLMGKEADSNAPMAGVTFVDVVNSGRAIVKILKEEEQVDMVICLSHSGTHPEAKRSEDVILAQQVSGIDVIISGHSHSLLAEPLRVGNTIVVSAGQYGSHLGVLQLQKTASAWEVSEYRLEVLDESIPPHPDMEAKISAYATRVEEDFLAPLGFGFDTILAYSDFSFIPYHRIGAEHQEEPLGNMIADAYRYAVAQAEGVDYTTVDVAVVPSGTIRGSFVQGPITAYDAFVVSSLGMGADGESGFPLLSVYLTGSELKAVCEVDASVTPLMSAAQLYMSGITYTFNPSRLPLNKVIETGLVQADGTVTAIEDERLYRVVAGLYSAQMLSVVGEMSYGLLPIVPKNEHGEPIEDFLEHIIYIETEDGNRELKEWMALAMYLQSFSPRNGSPAVPSVYEQPQGRKNIESERSLAAILGRPNHLAIRFYLLVAMLVLLAIAVICILRRRRKTI